MLLHHDGNQVHGEFNGATIFIITSMPIYENFKISQTDYSFVIVNTLFFGQRMVLPLTRRWG
jgi:hypothetical protein